MLSEVKDTLLDLEKCSLHELINILQKFASDPSINTNQAGFGSYIANHVLKEKISKVQPGGHDTTKAWGCMDPKGTSNYWKRNTSCYFTSWI
jgi:hypothetical protein